MHLGHSYGSIQTYGLTAAHPDISDGIVLTGFSQNSSFLPDFQYGGNFVSAPGTAAFAGKYVDGYLAAGDETGVQTNFFAPGTFSPDILTAAYNGGQPVTVGELLTIAGPVSETNTFEGPVLVITGDRDIPFCGGNCSVSDPSIPAQVQEYFPNTTYFDAFVVPETGHGLNLAYTHPLTYSTILDFLEQHV